VGAVTDSHNWGRDAVIGGAAGLLFGAVIGGFDAATSGPRISVHADVDRQQPEGSLALSGPTMRLGQHF